MHIPLFDLIAQYRSIQPDVDAAIQRVLASGQFILGEEASACESEIAAYLGVAHGVGVASGTDALILALRALEIGRGDEVILPAFSFFATVGAILHVGARPVFVDIDPHTYCLDVEAVAARLSGRTRAVIPVHLYGQPAEMDKLYALKIAHSFEIIEDNAQAFGAAFQGRKTGAWGDLACLSFFPTKPLGAYGDGGMVVTSNPALAAKVRRLRTHGWERKYYPIALGYNSRLDSLQAAILRAKLPHVEAWNEKRRQLGAQYSEALSGLPVGLPPAASQPDGPSLPVYHLFNIRVAERERLQTALRKAGIACEVYYPQPLHLAEPCRHLGCRPGDFPEAERACRETLAIPLYAELTEKQVSMILGTMKEFL